MQPSIRKKPKPSQPSPPFAKKDKKKRVKNENATRPRETYLTKGK